MERGCPLVLTSTGAQWPSTLESAHGAPTLPSPSVTQIISYHCNAGGQAGIEGPTLIRWSPLIFFFYGWHSIEMGDPTELDSKGQGYLGERNAL